MAENELGVPSVKGNKKVYLYVGGAAAVYVGYRYWKSRSAASTATTTPTDTTLGSSGVTDTAGGAYGPGNVQYAGTGSINGTLQTNAEWTQAAVQNMVSQGWDAQATSVALGKYLSAQALTDTEATIVQTAVALTGPPPSGSYYIIHTTGTTSTTKAPVSAPGGFHNIQPGRTAWTAGWNAVSGATGYEVQYKWTGTSAKTSNTNANIWGLKPNTKYEYRVRAYNATGSGPWSSYQWFQTQK
jgi:hypothetical protein